MKKTITLIIAPLLFLLLLTSCGEANQINTPEITGDAGLANTICIREEMGHEEEELMASSAEAELAMLHFSSLEDFLAAYRIVKAGGEIADLVTHWRAPFSDSDLADVSDEVNLSALERFYLPVNIPKEFQLYRIDIGESSVTVWYVHDDLLISESPYLDAMFQHPQRHFQFTFTRWEIDSPMDEVLQQNLRGGDVFIDGKFIFTEPNMLTWTSDKELIYMYTPLPVADSVSDLIRFTEFEVIDLLDDNAVSALLEYLSRDRDYVP